MSKHVSSKNEIKASHLEEDLLKTQSIQNSIAAVAFEYFLCDVRMLTKKHKINLAFRIYHPNVPSEDFSRLRIIRGDLCKIGLTYTDAHIGQIPPDIIFLLGTPDNVEPTTLPSGSEVQIIALQWDKYITKEPFLSLCQNKTHSLFNVEKLYQDELIVLIKEILNANSQSIKKDLNNSINRLKLLSSSQSFDSCESLSISDTDDSENPKLIENFYDVSFTYILKRIAIRTTSLPFTVAITSHEIPYTFKNQHKLDQNHKNKMTTASEKLKNFLPELGIQIEKDSAKADKIILIALLTGKTPDELEKEQSKLLGKTVIYFNHNTETEDIAEKTLELNTRIFHLLEALYQSIPKKFFNNAEDRYFKLIKRIKRYEETDEISEEKMETMVGSDPVFRCQPIMMKKILYPKLPNYYLNHLIRQSLNHRLSLLIYLLAYKKFNNLPKNLKIRQIKKFFPDFPINGKIYF